MEWVRRSEGKQLESSPNLAIDLQIVRVRLETPDILEAYSPRVLRTPTNRFLPDSDRLDVRPGNKDMRRLDTDRL